MTQTPVPSNQGGNTTPPTPTGREILRMGLWNYASNRWGPKNPVARLIVEIAVLVVFFLVLALVVALAQG